MKGEKTGVGERRGFSTAAFVLLAQWLSVNATHRASLLEREGYLCDMMRDGVCVCEHVRVWSAFVARCEIEFVCLLLGECALVCVCLHAYVLYSMCVFLRSAT